MDILKLGQSERYTLQAEKVKSKWWLELIERSTGTVQIIYCDTKVSCAITFARMSMEEVKTWMDRFKVESVPMYKANVM